jgi:hypothetical protein
MINDRYCWNCTLAEHECDSIVKNDFHGYCTSWTPTETEFDNTDDCKKREYKCDGSCAYYKNFIKMLKEPHE